MLVLPTSVTRCTALSTLRAIALVNPPYYTNDLCGVNCAWRVGLLLGMSPFRLLYNAMIITELKISTMPKASRRVKSSPKRKMPISTAVRGSSAPMMAVGVEPMYLAAYTIITKARMAGTTGDAARNKVQTMPDDGGATVKIELPRNWNQLMEELGYEALKEFYIKRRFACDHHSAHSSTPSSPHHSDYYSISDIYCSIWALRSGRSTSITFQIPSSSIW